MFDAWPLQVRRGPIVGAALQAMWGNSPSAAPADSQLVLQVISEGHSTLRTTHGSARLIEFLHIGPWIRFAVFVSGCAKLFPHLFAMNGTIIWLAINHVRKYSAMPLKRLWQGSYAISLCSKTSWANCMMITATFASRGSSFEGHKLNPSPFAS